MANSRRRSSQIQHVANSFRSRSKVKIKTTLFEDNLIQQGNSFMCGSSKQSDSESSILKRGFSINNTSLGGAAAKKIRRKSS